MPTTATFVIDFSGYEDAFLSVELDEDKNNGKTSFSKGDVVHFRVYSDVPYNIKSTSGGISPGTTNKQLEVKNEVLSFVGSDPVNTAKKIKSITDITWYGNNLGSIDKIGTNQVKAKNATDSSIGIASINYLTEYDEYAITPPADMSDIWSILILIEAV